MDHYKQVNNWKDFTTITREGEGRHCFTIRIEVVLLKEGGVALPNHKD